VVSVKAKRVVEASSAMTALSPVTQIARVQGAEKLDLSLRMAESFEELEALFAGRMGLDADGKPGLDAGHLLAAMLRGAGLARELRLPMLPTSPVWAELAVKVGSIVTQLEPRGLSQLATVIPMLSEHCAFVLESLTAATRQRLRAGGFTGAEDFRLLSDSLRASQLGVVACPKLWKALVEEADAQEKVGRLNALGVSVLQNTDGSPTALGAARAFFQCPKCRADWCRALSCETCSNVALRTVCLFCNGSGRLQQPCPDCVAGKQLINPRNCASCKGRGRVDYARCDNCQGHGYRPCPDCATAVDVDKLLLEFQLVPSLDQSEWPGAGKPRPICKDCFQCNRETEFRAEAERLAAKGMTPYNPRKR